MKLVNNKTPQTVIETTYFLVNVNTPKATTITTNRIKNDFTLLLSSCIRVGISSLSLSFLAIYEDSFFTFFVMG